MSTSDKFPRVLDSGDALNEKPGRKFEYTDADFMLAYFGKDNARNASLAVGQSEVFGFNESFKKRFPVDKYLHAPGLRAQRQLVEDRTDLNPLDSESRDQQLNDILQHLDSENMEYDMVKDRTHPADKNRTLLKEAQTTLETYLARKKK
jgi:hypothetical protein